MDKINIEGVILTTLKKICHPKGDIFHGLKKSDEGFTGFGETYFSSIKQDQIKGWNKHKRATLNLIVPTGIVTFVIYDDRLKAHSKNNFFEINLSPENYLRLTVPPGLWLAFRGKSKNTNLILSVSDIEHDPDEIERLEFDQIVYKWRSN